MSLNLVNNNKQTSSNVYNVVEELQDYMFTANNLARYTKNIYNPYSINKQKQIKDVVNNNTIKIPKHITNKYESNIYKPLKKDSLFWCFFILKYGYAKYEMDIGSQYFIIEKTEKFNNIELLRTKENKDLLKINKIKYTEITSDLANNECISIKTFFALCIIEKMNILLVDGRKIYQSINNDNPLINVIHRNSKTHEHYIELNVSNDNITNYRENYYNVSGFESVLKSISSYKVDDLLDLCKKLNITKLLEDLTNTKSKKLTKKDIYEIIVQNF